VPTYPKLENEHADQAMNPLDGIAFISLDADLRGAFVSRACGSIYGFTPAGKVNSLADIVEARIAYGWCGIAEALGQQPSVDTRLAEVRSCASLSTLHFSPKGVAVLATHQWQGNGKGVLLTYIPTDLRIEPESPSSDVDAVLRLIQQSLQKRVGHRFALQQLLHEGGRHIGVGFVSDMAGRSIMLGSRNPPSDPALPSSLEDLRVDWDAFYHDCEMFGHATQTILQGAGRRLVISASTVEVFPSGPKLVYGHITPVAGILSEERILRHFPQFTLNEAIAVSTLAQGHPIKSAARALGKSPVTVALQARSALNKTTCGTMAELLTEVTVLCCME
jgi:DNA-binding CsgD family transcriptional regulator